MSPLRENLANKNFFLLWLGQIISQFGDRITQMSLIGLIAERMPGSTLGLAKVIAVTIIPVFIIGPVASVYVDRWDRRRVLFFCDLLRGLLVLMIPVLFLNAKSLVPVYVIIFLAFCLSRFHVPAKMSIIPDLVPAEHLVSANFLVSSTGMIAFVLGIFLGGLIVERWGPRGGFLVDAATFFVSAFFMAAIHRRYQRGPADFNARKVWLAMPKTVLAEIKEAFHYLTDHQDLRFIAHTFFILLAAGGCVYVVIIVFIQETFQTVTRDLGFLAPFLGMGLFFGALLYGRYGQKISPYKVIFSCLALGGGMLIIFALAVYYFPVRLLAVGLSFLLGFMIGPIFIAANTLVHQVCDDHMRGKVFGGLEIVIHLAFLLAMVSCAWLADHLPRVWILAGVGGIITVVGMIGWARYKPSGG